MAQLQESDAQFIYDSRGPGYDDSWHPRFARHIIELAIPQPGEHVLDLACGTGLVTFPAAQAVGPSGLVIGVDISNGMLNEARRKLSRNLFDNIKFYQHSITDLLSLGALDGHEGTFDLITIASALVLLPDPANAVKDWVKWLKPGGQLIVDVTHPQSQLAGILLERVGKRMRIPVPHHRLNFMKPEDLQTMLEDAGLTRVTIKAMSQLAIEGTEALHDYMTSFDSPRIEREYSIYDADTVFEKLVNGPAKNTLSNSHTRDQARQVFAEEWGKLANADGKVVEYDCVFVGLGWKS